MRRVFLTDRAALFQGDSRAALEVFAPGSVDAVVCDPPYELGFTGRAWDATGIAYDVGLWRTILEVLKPGGHLLAFGGTRTYHRMACAIEDAGFEVRDCIQWIYGTGFPKSLNVSKAIDGAAGANREPDVFTGVRGVRAEAKGNVYGTTVGGVTTIARAPAATAAAAAWEGWGTALKPANEPVILARKPLTGTVAGNVLAHGTGALNIDACRIGVEQTVTSRYGHSGDHGVYGSDPRTFERLNPPGRWPANVLLDEEAAAMLDGQSGIAKPRKAYVQKHTETPNIAMAGGNQAREVSIAADPGGGASRYFYCAKASRSEREIGCEALPFRTAGETTERLEGSDGLNSPRAGAGRTTGARNNHPTVKPIALMRWLCRLITPPGGMVFDPFCGSGSTGVAALAEGFEFVGIEREDDYIPIAKARLEHALGGQLKGDHDA